ncbi:hypothetical protein SOMG_00051 [Schizosaccharomyces osmophilus]|uniref:Uncharacterized protein n=1 Tax=Schizosaccharomyces osmophilus TaxID=2545709 RepID=A0AAF0AWB6_9SCHI|nr:uncharacterized protein SOMG_00051 [Schizosaccharomyces osmophilus]WBW72754.1 hypothetical protein SOMG_00051 [Schizosaccharomyces osmophilus]
MANAPEGYSSDPESKDPNDQKGPAEVFKTAKHFKGDVEEAVGKVIRDGTIWEKGKTMKGHIESPAEAYCSTLQTQNSSM